MVQNCHYEVSNIGRVRNSQNQFILKQRPDKYGYPTVGYCDYDRVSVFKKVHRLVAIAWLPNEDNLPQVSHKDGDKLNNYVSNLEWCSAKTNIIHSYENLLNSNTTPVTLIDLETAKELGFRSIKYLAKHLNTASPMLVPMIKNSINNPIYGKYAIRINDVLVMQETANSVNFGKRVFVYDAINESLATYSSLIIAGYHTGIRNFTNIKETVFRIGYFITFDEKEIPEYFDIDKEKELINRKAYLNVPYRKRDAIYYIYDYYTKVEKVFDTLDECCKYLNSTNVFLKYVTQEEISGALGNGRKSNRTWIIRGFGIKSSIHDYEWFPHSEEVILSNRYGYPRTFKIYDVTIDGKTERIFGFMNLCKYLNYDSDKLLRRTTHEDIVKDSNIPNLSVRRLDLPITEIR